MAKNGDDKASERELLVKGLVKATGITEEDARRRQGLELDGP
ncbi:MULTISPECIES: hypothetical protein [unclassified Mesorhizobium]|nr:MULTISPECIES: hypothetical protein [unclassified Mesorhizobium]